MTVFIPKCPKCASTDIEIIKERVSCWDNALNNKVLHCRCCGKQLFGEHLIEQTFKLQYEKWSVATTGVKLTCAYCGTTFHRLKRNYKKDTQHNFCCREHSNAFRRGKNLPSQEQNTKAKQTAKTGSWVPCVLCRKEVYRKPSRLKAGKLNFCCPEHHRQYQASGKP